ncbi:MAG: hypothetical protein ACT4OE_01105 [Sphingosinicella sp.]
MSEASLAFLTYRSDKRDEWIMRIGPEGAPPILFVPPLFEEMNRMRALITATMRRLAERGLGCWLPDLKGTGESVVPLEEARWGDWRHDVNAASEHVQAAAGMAPLIVSIRGACLIDDAAAGRGWWRLAPIPGRSLARDMARSGLAGVAWAGYAPAADLRGRLEDAEPYDLSPLRVVRLASDNRPADTKLDGPALWRRSEPGGSIVLARAIAEDVSQWHATCASS